MTSFEARRVSRSQTIRLNASPETVFPLFTPEEEKKWAAGWDFEWVYPPGLEGRVETHTVFKTSAHDHHHGEAIWIISHYDSEAYQIAYYRVEPGVKVGHIRVDCQAATGGQTSAAITYTYTGLSEAGNRFIEEFTAAHYRQFIASWERAINYYLETGETLPPGH